MSDPAIDPPGRPSGVSDDPEQISAAREIDLLHEVIAKVEALRDKWRIEASRGVPDGPAQPTFLMDRMVVELTRALRGEDPSDG